jgi:hypothetical protein
VTNARWYEAGGQNTPAAAHARWYEAGGTGSPAVIVNALPDLANVEPESTITVTATLVGGGTADTWTWRRVSGPTIGIIGTGATVTFTAPSDINGATVVVGVTATIDATTSPERTFTVNVLAQTEWWWTGTGWIPQVETWAA